MKRVTEADYPITFRTREADALERLIHQHQSVVLIGMKRVGISNFLRFFLSHYNKPPRLYVLVDLNDLIERNLSAFWTLFLTRIVDSVQHSKLPEKDKKAARKLFVQSIQLKDHFFTLDSVRKVLETLVSADVSPTIFLVRFDRLQGITTPEFFSNIIGLTDAVEGKMAYVFTSFREIPELGPVFAKNMYLPIAKERDMEIILGPQKLDEKTRRDLITLAGGYIQYLQLAVIALHEGKKLTELSADEQIILQSEELFESLTKKEKDVLLSSNRDPKDASYLWNTGMVRADGSLFSPLFTMYIKGLSIAKEESKEFTKKEHVLFTFLKNHEGQLCEREAIIDAVWSDAKDLGVSDWAIDRLIARLRNKLKQQHSPYSIVTVVTRGYKLIHS